MSEERDAYMRRQEADHDLLRMRNTPRGGFRAIRPTSPAHAAVLEDLARRIDDE